MSKYDFISEEVKAELNTEECERLKKVNLRPEANYRIIKMTRTECSSLSGRWVFVRTVWMNLIIRTEPKNIRNGKKGSGKMSEKLKFRQTFGNMRGLASEQQMIKAKEVDLSIATSKVAIISRT